METYARELYQEVIFGGLSERFLPVDPPAHHPKVCLTALYFQIQFLDSRHANNTPLKCVS